MKLKSLFIVIVLSLLQGCSFITAQVKTPPLPANLKRACLDPATLPPSANMGDLLDVAVANKLALVECGARNKALVEAWPKQP